jgi:hypothetical protein
MGKHHKKDKKKKNKHKRSHRKDIDELESATKRPKYDYNYIPVFDKLTPLDA